MTSLEMLLCLVLIAFSAYLSASEVALFSLSRFQLRFLKENFRSIHRKIKHLLADPSGLLITILVGNEIINITLATIIARNVSQRHPPVPPWIQDISPWVFETLLGTLITTPIVLIFCEITPKVIGVNINQLVSTLAAAPLSIIYEFFAPIRSLLKYIIVFFMRIIGYRWIPPPSELQHHKNGRILLESDFLMMVEEGHREGAIQESELELIRSVFKFDNTIVSEVTTPLSQVLSLPAHTTLKAALTTMRGQRYSRIPIVGSNRKEVLGILYGKDLLRSKLYPDSASNTVATLMRKPLFVNSQLKLNALFKKFKQQRTHMAVVKNPAGDIVSVVTMSDVLDALFEDLFTDDEHLNARSHH